MIKKELPLIVNRDCQSLSPVSLLFIFHVPTFSTDTDPSEEAAEVEWRFDEAGENNNN